VAGAPSAGEPRPNDRNALKIRRIHWVAFPFQNTYIIVNFFVVIRVYSTIEKWVASVGPKTNTTCFAGFAAILVMYDAYLHPFKRVSNQDRLVLIST
jgi:hypothetical protein